MLYVGAARRLRADRTKDPDQASVFGSGYGMPVTDYEDRSKRKPELFISAGTESLTEEGKYAPGAQLNADRTTPDVGELFKRVGEGQEVYFCGNIYRLAGEVGGNDYDKLKISCIFAQETDRVQQRRANSGGRRKHPPCVVGLIPRLKKTVRRYWWRKC